MSGWGDVGGWGKGVEITVMLLQEQKQAETLHKRGMRGEGDEWLEGRGEG